MLRLATFTAVAALAGFGFAGTVMAGKPGPFPSHNHGTSGFSAPFLDVGNGVEVSPTDGLSSKGELDNDGRWGVDTGDVGGSGGDFVLDGDTVEICLQAVAAPVGTPLFLTDFTADGAGNILTSGNIGAGNEGSWRGPRLQIRDDAVLAGTCVASVCTVGDVGEACTVDADCDLGPVDNYLSQTIMQAMQIMDMKAWAVLS